MTAVTIVITIALVDIAGLSSAVTTYYGFCQ